MKYLVIAAAAAFGLSTPGAVEAQDVRGIALEVRGGFNAPFGNFEDRGAEAEVGFGGDVFLNLTPAFSVYGGWGRSQFDCLGCDNADDLHSSGPELGVKLIAPRRWGVLPWARVGTTYHKLGGTIGAVEFNSDREFGLQASLGADIPLGEVLSLSPAVRVHNWNAPFDGPIDAFSLNQNVRYVSLDLGAHFHLR